MVEKILVNNLEKYDLSFFSIVMQLRTINFLQENKALNEKNTNVQNQKLRRIYNFVQPQ